MKYVGGPWDPLTVICDAYTGPAPPGVRGGGREEERDQGEEERKRERGRRREGGEGRTRRGEKQEE